MRRDYSHPCVVTWVPFNESWGVPDLPARPRPAALRPRPLPPDQGLDPTRPVIGNDGWEHTASDIWGVHDYARRRTALRER